MSRPATKKDLLISAQEGYEKLWGIIDSLPEALQITNFNFEDRDKNIKDVLVHLYEWHQLLLKWISNNKKGIESPFLKEPYNWKTYPNMNIEFWEKHQKTTYEEAKKLVASSHQEVMKVIESFTNEELFEKKHYSWTGTTNVGSYCISSTSSHYDWAIKKIKKHIKALKDEKLRNF